MKAKTFILLCTEINNEITVEHHRISRAKTLQNTGKKYKILKRIVELLVEIFNKCVVIHTWS